VAQVFDHSTKGFTMPEGLMYRTVVAKNNQPGEHRAGRFLTPTDDDAIKKARANFEAAPILKKLVASPGFRFEVTLREPADL
jgi:hypothetical protein